MKLYLKSYCNPFSFTPIVKIWILSNKIIKFDTCSEPMVKRAKIIHMDSEFTDTPLKPNQYKKDPEFVRQLENIYIDEVFSFIVEGAFEYYKYKSFGDEECESMKSYKNEYMGKIDISQSFLNDRCEIGPKFKIKTSDIFDSYVDYCKEHDVAMVKRNKFYESLSNKKIFTKKIRGIDYYGIRLKNNHVEDDTDAVDELEYGIDKIDEVKIDKAKVDKVDEVKVDEVKAVCAKELLVKQLQEKQIIDDSIFEQEDIEIKKIIKEQNLIKQVIISYNDLDSDTVKISRSDSDTDSYSDSDSDSDVDINEIGTEDYSFLN